MATPRDDNSSKTLYGVSHLDGVTPVAIALDPSSRALLVDFTTAIAFDPALVRGAQTDDDFPTAKGTSSADDATVLPWVVNASTGAVLVDN